MEPTNDEATIRKVLAEFMGWTGQAQHTMTGKWYGFPPGHADYREALPDYTHDLNAMHEVEAELCDRGFGLHWITELRKIVDIEQREYLAKMETPTTMGLAWADLCYRLAHATAEQRARAAYAVIKAQQGTTNPPTASKE